MQQPIHEAPPAARPQTSAPTEEVQVAQEDESWMTKVDTDVSRQVPAAMEPLALLAAEDEQQ